MANKTSTTKPAASRAASTSRSKPIARSSAPQAKAAPSGKTAAKTATKTVAKASSVKTLPASTPATKAVQQPVQQPAVEQVKAKAEKNPNKPRPVLVRDSFTMPEADFALIATLKATAMGGQRAAKKSELLRAGLQMLAGLDAKALVQALDRLEAVKTGRPKKGAHK